MAGHIDVDTLSRRQVLGLTSQTLVTAGLLPSPSLPNRLAKIPERNRIAHLTSQIPSIRVSTEDEPRTFDPLMAQNTSELTIAHNVFDRLVNRNPAGQLVPGLAERWEFGNDDLTCRFYLRETHFHDGTPFEADSVKATFDRILAVGDSLEAGILNSARTEVQAIESHVAELRLANQYAGILDVVASPRTSIVSPAYISEGSGALAAPVGTGAYMLGYFNAGEPIDLIRNPDHWQGSDVPFDAVTILTTRGDAVVSVMLQAGEIDAAKVSGPSIAAIAGLSGVSLSSTTSPRLYHWAMNLTQPAFQDTRVRKAFNLAIDRDTIVGQVLQGQGVPAVCPIAPGLPGYVPLNDYRYDPDQARRLLDEAGFLSDWRGRVQVNGDYIPYGTAVETAIQEMLDRIGVAVELDVLPWAEYYDALYAPVDSDFAEGRDFAQFTYGTLVPEETYRSTLMSDSFPPLGWNVAFFQDPAVDARIEAVIGAPQSQRLSHLESLSREVFGLAPWIFSHFELDTIARGPNAEGVSLATSGALVLGAE